MTKKKDFFALILAGGSGSRLWPLSREMFPKQLLKLNQSKTLFQSTFIRLTDLIKKENIYSITNIKQAENLKIQLAQIDESISQNVLSEPLGRNTAPAIMLGVKHLQKYENDPIIIVSPSDHLIPNQKKFNESLEKAYKLAQEGYIVTFGIKPTKPDTGFGYIKSCTDENLNKIAKDSRKVEEFKEKPDLETAKKYVNSGNYYWNGGIFIFKASSFVNEIKKHSPEIFEILNKAKVSTDMPSVSFEEYEKLPNISIDYAVMEKSENIALVPIDCGWNDLGSWDAIYSTSPKDTKNNYIKGKVIDIDTQNSFICSTSKLVAAIGLKDVVIVETPDAILACDKFRTQEVKKIYDQLKENNDEIYLVHKTVYKTWGYYTVLTQGEDFLTREVHINPKSKIESQKHLSRSEHWIILTGSAKIIKENKEFILKAGNSMDIGVDEVHSIENTGDEDLKILEVQKGKFISPKDVIRIN